MPAELSRYVGSVRPQLMCLRIHMQWFDSDQMIREIAMENPQNDEDAYEEPEEACKAMQTVSGFGHTTHTKCTGSQIILGCFTQADPI